MKCPENPEHDLAEPQGKGGWLECLLCDKFFRGCKTGKTTPTLCKGFAAMQQAAMCAGKQVPTVPLMLYARPGNKDRNACLYASRSSASTMASHAAAAASVSRLQRSSWHAHPADLPCHGCSTPALFTSRLLLLQMRQLRARRGRPPPPPPGRWRPKGRLTSGGVASPAWATSPSRRPARRSPASTACAPSAPRSSRRSAPLASATCATP